MWICRVGGQTRVIVRAAVIAASMLGALCFASVASALTPPHIYWSALGRETIAEANLDGTRVNQNFIGADAPFGVAVDGQHVYWANASGSIGEANLDGTGVNESFITGIDPDAVAVDGQHIYWADNPASTIGRANLDGTGVNESFITGASFPEGVAVDGQHIYWPNFGSGTIGEANLDGTGVNENFISGATLPVGVAVDGHHIYWANFHAGTIGEANLDGTGVNQSFISGAIVPEGVAVDDEHIYWANDSGSSIGEANLDGTGVNESFISGTLGPTGVAASVAVAAVSPASPPAFAATPQGTLSQPLTLTVSNQGQRNLSVAGLSFAGADPGDFVISSDSCRGSVAPGESCQLTVSFAPQAQGSREAILQIASNDFANSPLQVPLTGTGSPPPHTILNGSGPPASSLGNDGDFYIDTTANLLYGPKAGGVWPSPGVPLVGPQGAPGQNGTSGTNGTNGNTVLHGVGAPSDAFGDNGDFYIDTAAHVLYGPKANGHWPASGTPLVGPIGPTGATGQTGPQGPPGMPVCRNTLATILVCDALFVPGTWTMGPRLHATDVLSRGDAVYARGDGTIVRSGRIALRLHKLRPVNPGRYTLTVRLTGHRRHLTMRRTVTIR